MPTTKSEEATNARCITKDDAISACRAAMTQMVELVCGTQEKTITVAEHLTEEQIAVAFGGSVVSFGLAKAGQRVVIVRIAVGMLTSSFVAESLPQALYVIEHVDSAVAPNVAKVTAPLLKEVARHDFVPIANAIKATAPIVGDSVLMKAISKAGAEFNVISAIWDTYQNLRADLSGHNDEVARQKTQTACCDCSAKAAKAAWKEVPTVFHRESYKTQTGAPRFYGKKPQRK